MGSLALELRDVGKSYGALEIIKRFRLDVEQGEFIVLVGPSGCGKSTLLRMIAGLETVSRGDIAINGRNVTSEPPGHRGIAMVFQNYALYPHMTVSQNMGFALKNARMKTDEIDRRVTAAAAILDIAHLLERRPAQLSGGQRQRIAIGRAIVREPDVFLFDEPLSNLDAALRVQTRVEIAKLHKRLGNTIVYVTHDQVEAMTLADRIVVLNRGAPEQIGSPEDLYERPATKFVAGFIGTPKMNFLEGELCAGRFRLQDGTLIDLPARFAAVTGIATLGIRPEHLWAADGGQLSGSLEVQEYLGDRFSIHVRLADGTSLVASSEAKQQIGSLRLKFDPEKVHLFSADGTSLAAHPQTAGVS